MYKAQDLRERSLEDLKELEKSLRNDIFQNRFKNFTNRLDDTSAMRKTRRDLARVITLLAEKAQGITRTAGAPKAARPARPAAKAKAKAKAAPRAPKSAPALTAREQAEDAEAAKPAKKAADPSHAQARANPKRAAKSAKSEK